MQVNDIFNDILNDIFNDILYLIWNRQNKFLTYIFGIFEHLVLS